MGKETDDVRKTRAALGKPDPGADIERTRAALREIHPKAVPSGHAATPTGKPDQQGQSRRQRRATNAAKRSAGDGGNGNNHTGGGKDGGGGGDGNHGDTTAAPAPKPFPWPVILILSFLLVVYLIIQLASNSMVNNIMDFKKSPEGHQQEMAKLSIEQTQADAKKIMAERRGSTAQSWAAAPDIAGPFQQQRKIFKEACEQGGFTVIASNDNSGPFWHCKVFAGKGPLVLKGDVVPSIVGSRNPDVRYKLRVGACSFKPDSLPYPDDPLIEEWSPMNSPSLQQANQDLRQKFYRKETWCKEIELLNGDYAVIQAPGTGD
jgi:hypothetical protein